MTFDDLREQWQESNARSFDPQRREEALLGACRRAEKFRWVIVRRDTSETAVAILGIVFFGFAAIALDEVVARVGAALVVVSLIFIIYKLRRARKAGEPAQLDASVHDYLEQELAGVDRQIELLRTIAGWYIIPAMVGCVMVFCGTSSSLIECMVYVAGAVLLSWGIYVANQYAVTSDLMPLRDGLKKLLIEFDEAPD